MTGPSDKWYGVGFNAGSMEDLPYTIVVDGDGKVTERKLDQHAPGHLIATSVKVLSNTVDKNGNRTVVLNRPLIGLTKDHYTFSPNLRELKFINAIGKGKTFAYHKDKGASTLILLAKDNNCVCVNKDDIPFGKGTGYLIYEDTQVSLHQNCLAAPYGVLLQQKNPTCDVRTYVGGQQCCHHMWSLLDKDQEIPWKDQPLEYHMKFRYWFQEYDENKHQTLDRWTWGGIAGPVEYDVPQCAPGTPTEDCVIK
eukprot:UN06980